ncbi:hypothetical protein [Streptomyces sp. NPDC059850]|uniref:hypothetical protein n=1 Tax=Streptomyces sp. NPDC059850 TaxID=3346970 RepID=UPI0036686975
MSTEETDTPQTPDDDHPRPRRRSRLAVVSVAAAVLVAGGGSAYWASTAANGGGSQGPGSGGTPQPLALDAYAAPAGHEGIAVGEPDPSGGDRYVVKGKLPDGPDEAPVYRTGAKVTKADVARLAKALDVSGSPRAEHGSWKVGGTEDGRGPVLRVSEKGPGSWSFSRFGTPGGDTCVRPPSAGPKADSTSCPTYRDGEKKSGTDKSGKSGDDKAVSEEKAKRTAGPVLKALGLSGAKLDAGGRYGAVRMVNADPVLDELPTHGWTTSLQIGADGGLVGGSGMLAEPTEADSYPLISAGQALKKLNATAPKSGAKGAGKVTVKSVTFGLASHSVAGQRALVPSWIFKTEPTGANGVAVTLPYPAVKPEFIKKNADQPKDTGGEAPGQGQKRGEPGTPGRGSKADDITSYSADGKTLTLRFWGGVCDTYSVSAEETSKTVTVEVESKPKRPGQACILMAKEMTKKVTLDKPLDGREVVDKSTGDKIPAQKK